MFWFVQLFSGMKRNYFESLRAQTDQNNNNCKSLARIGTPTSSNRDEPNRKIFGSRPIAITRPTVIKSLNSIDAILNRPSVKKCGMPAAPANNFGPVSSSRQPVMKENVAPSYISSINANRCNKNSRHRESDVMSTNQIFAALQNFKQVEMLGEIRVDVKHLVMLNFVKLRPSRMVKSLKAPVTEADGSIVLSTDDILIMLAEFKTVKNLTKIPMPDPEKRQVKAMKEVTEKLKEKIKNEEQQWTALKQLETTIEGILGSCTSEDKPTAMHFINLVRKFFIKGGKHDLDGFIRILANNFSAYNQHGWQKMIASLDVGGSLLRIRDFVIANPDCYVYTGIVVGDSLDQRMYQHRHHHGLINYTVVGKFDNLSDTFLSEANGISLLKGLAKIGKIKGFLNKSNGFDGGRIITAAKDAKFFTQYAFVTKTPNHQVDYSTGLMAASKVVERDPSLPYCAHLQCPVKVTISKAVIRSLNLKRINKKCEECAKFFASSSTLKMHQVKYHMEDKFICRVCDDVLLYREVRNHLKVCFFYFA